MKYRGLIGKTLFVLFVGILALNNLNAGQGGKRLKEYPVTKFGKFIADKSDKATITINHTTINKAIAVVGKKGGGTVKLPEGTYFIGPFIEEGKQNENAKQAIFIEYDNITLAGAGMDKTCLKTNGTFVKDAFMHGPNSVGGRGNGIWVTGERDPDKPRNNITLRDFELDGQAGWNGDYSLNYKKGSENGWDMWHKGIIVSNGDYVDNVLVENVYVHRFRGEVLYTGGAIGTLTVRGVKSGDTNASCFNFWALEMLVEDCDFGDDNCRFWVESGVRSSAYKNKEHNVVFRNNNFRNAREHGSGISITQGEWNDFPYIIEGNTFDTDQDILACHGGIKGPIKFINNKVRCGGELFHTFAYPGWLNSPMNANILIENNEITGSSLASLNAYARDVVIRNNVFTGIDKHSKSVEYGVGTVKNILVEGNTFKNCLPPKENPDWKDAEGYTEEFSRPLFRDNKYIDEIKKEQHAKYYIMEDYPLVTPYYEYIEIGLNSNAVDFEFETDGYPQGQLLHVRSQNWTKVKLSAGKESYYVEEDRFLNYGKNTITFQFDAEKKLWIELREE